MILNYDLPQYSRNLVELQDLDLDLRLFLLLPLKIVLEMLA